LIQSEYSPSKRNPLEESTRSKYGSVNKSSSVEPSLIFMVRECFKDILAVEGEVERGKEDLKGRVDFTLAGVFNVFTGYS
jgi:hypothetical protein